MKDLLSKQHYCYKTHTSLMKTSAYLLFYRQLNPPLHPTPIWLYGLPPIFTKKILIPPWKFFYKNPNCHISKGGGEGGGHTMNITYDLLKQSYNGEMDEGYICVWSTMETSRKQQEIFQVMNMINLVSVLECSDK